MQRFALAIVLIILMFSCVSATPVAVSHYSLQLKLDPNEGTLSTSARMTIVNHGETARNEIPFLLYRLFNVEAVRAVDGSVLEYSQTVLGLTGEPTLQANSIKVRLHSPLQPGGSVVVVVKYGGFLFGYPEVMQYVRDRIDTAYTLIRPDAFAYPMLCEADYKDMHAAYDALFTYDLEVSVPRGYTVACGGNPINTSTGGDAATFRFTSKIPTWRMDIASARFATIENPDKKLAVYVLPADTAGARVVLRQMERVLEYYSSTFGAIADYRGYTAIEIPDGWGSQASDFYFLQTAAAFRDTTKMDEVYHELAHMWNVHPEGELKNCRFFDEAFAMYFQYLADAHFLGTTSLDAGLKRSRESFVAWSVKDRKNAVTPIAEYGKYNIGVNSYRKGPVALYVLNRIIGDQAFHAMIGAMRTEFATTPVTFQSFQKLAERISGKDLHRYFDEWIFGTESSALLAGNASLDQIAERYR